MSVFRRKPREDAASPAASATDPQGGTSFAAVPVARDLDLAVPPFRPVPIPGGRPDAAAAQRESAAMALAPSRPTTPTALPPQPGARTGGGAPGLPGPAGRGPATGAQAPGGGANGAPTGPERRTLVVGKGISLQGTVSDAERLVVEGTVESAMIAAQELHIAHAGVFKGEVVVDEAEIAGVFDGTLTARDTLVIRATGRVLGVARCRRLQVEEGGQLSGRMEMLGAEDVVAPHHQHRPAAGPAPQPAPERREMAEAFGEA